MTAVMDEIMTGACTDAQIGAFLVALRNKGETVEEISGAAAVMRAKATRVPAAPDVMDTCGTGGDGQRTFNISTAAAITAAAAGARVAKHGNRSVSSSSGSSQVLEELGVNVQAPVEAVARCVEEARIGFLFAPSLHAAMKYAIGPRKEIGIRTIFNVLGPLTNPAGARRQLMGVYDTSLVKPMAEVLHALGARRALVVHGCDGMDEITITGPTATAVLDDGVVEEGTITPEDFGMRSAPVDDLRVESAPDSAEMIRAVFAGEGGPARDVVLLNAGAAVYVAGLENDIAGGILRAAHAIDSGDAAQTLRKLVELSQG
jgi:anthranilate phosphoribosyltransferase